MNQETKARYDTLHDEDKKIIDAIIERTYERDAKIREFQILLARYTDE